MLASVSSSLLQTAALQPVTLKVIQYSTYKHIGTKKVVDVVNNSDIYLKHSIFLFIMSY